MKKILFLLSILFVTTLLISCYEDTKEYTYEEVLSSIQFIFAEDDDFQHVTNDIVLPTSSPLDNNAVFSWESSNESILSTQGIVNRPAFDTEVILILSLQVGSIARQEIYTFTVIGTTIYYTVTFDIEGNLEQVEIESGQPVSEPLETPEKENHTFTGWFLNDVSYDFDNPVTSDITLTAIFEPITSVQYVIEIYEQRIEDNTYQRKSNVILFGMPGTTVEYLQPNEGFHLNQELSTLSGLVTVESTLILKAYYDRNLYETIFIYNGNEVGTATTKHGALLSLISAPLVPGFSFSGWFIDIELEEAYEPELIVTENFTLYAKYEELTEAPYTLNIYYENITNDDYSLVSTNTEILPIGTHVSYTEPVEGFNLDEGISHLEDTIETYEGVTLNVYYTRVRYDVSFVDENVIFETTVKFQDLIAQIDDPIKDDYAFLGWTRTFNGSNLFDFSTPIASDITLYAVWQNLNIPVYEGYYESLNDLPDYLVKSELTSIITPMNDRGYTFAITILQQSDVDPNNSNNIILVYDRYSRPKVWSSGAIGTWNREHVWPQSKLGTASVSDVHNLKPADPQTNSSRGNSPFGDDGIRTTNGYIQGGSFYFPGDEDKGDIARIVLYMNVRWGLAITTNGIGDINTFLQWHIEDPVDDFERNRNNVIYTHQNNRNPFIDHPELVERIWGTITTSTNESVSFSFYEEIYFVDVVIDSYDLPYHKREDLIYA